MSDFPKLGSPALRALTNARLTQLEQLTNISETELSQLHGMGPNALGKLREALKERGLSFRKDANRREQSMNQTIRAQLDRVRSEDGQEQNQAYHFLMEKTERPVDWAYEAWDDLLAGLTHKDNHVRAISAQVLANLAHSDPKGRMLKDFGKLLNVAKDERFVTARHCLQSIWKVGLAGRKQQQMVVEGLEKRFYECASEKNCTLIRFDIVQDLRHLYDAVKDDAIKMKALELIEAEADLKYRKKYAGAWKGAG